MGLIQMEVCAPNCAQVSYNNMVTFFLKGSVSFFKSSFALKYRKTRTMYHQHHNE